MEYPLLAPVERCVIKCIAVDRAVTKVRDDGFRITRKGKWTQIDMVAVIAPEEKLQKETLVEVLRKQAESGSRSQLGLFRPGVRYPYGLSDVPRNVLVVTHLIHLNELVREEVSVSRAVVEPGSAFSHERYEESARFFEDEIAIMRSVRTKRRLHRHVEGYRHHSELFRERGDLLLYAVIELFNDTCRLLANELESPFITFLHPRESQPGFRLGGFARFNCPLQDPCAFINATNLVRRLNGHEPFLDRTALEEILPRII